jgi:hypothetical protein
MFSMETTMSFWKSLFGGATSKTTKEPKREDYNGYTIESAPVLEGGQYQLAGRITKTIDGTIKEHNFMRADRFSSFEDAENFAFVKARQIIDQSGDRIFN